MEDIKSLFREQTKEIERHIDVLKEDFDDKIKLLAESFSGIEDQLVAIREMVAKNTEDIEIIKMDIQFIKQELKHKVDRDEFEALEKRVALLESKR